MSVGLLRALRNNAGFILLLALWTLWVRRQNFNSIVLPSPLSVLEELATHIGFYVDEAAVTILTTSYGLMVGVGVGTAVAVLASLSGVLKGLLAPLGLLLTSIPIAALIPLIARIVGYDRGGSVAIVAIISFLPVFVHAGTGLRKRLPLVHDYFLVTGAKPLRSFCALTLPAALPDWITGVRLAAAQAVVSGLMAEFLVGSRGLGAVVQLSMTSYDSARGIAASLIATLISIVALELATRLESCVQRRFG